MFLTEMAPFSSFLVRVRGWPLKPPVCKERLEIRSHCDPLFPKQTKMLGVARVLDRTL